MENQPSTSDDDQEPPRVGIPDDFIWRPEYQAWFAPGEPSDWDREAFRRRVDELIRQQDEESIANGAWNNGTAVRMPPLRDAPQRMRKSLRDKSEERLPLFPDDDDEIGAEASSASADLDDDDDLSDRFA